MVVVEVGRVVGKDGDERRRRERWPHGVVFKAGDQTQILNCLLETQCTHRQPKAVQLLYN